MTVLLLALNEVNFDAVRAYAASGKLPNLAGLIAKHGLMETTSEERHEELEPWIQWVTAQTGLTLAEHGVFRLGDIVNHDVPQIWEILEDQGLTVGAISPMNAKNRCRKAAFFIPDPWTETTVTGTPLMRKFHRAVAQSVNENAHSRLTISSAFWLAIGMAAYARPTSYGSYLSLMLAALRGKSWARALVLDLLLADIFIRSAKRARVNFASLFLNAAAHIQHHYMFSSAVYFGDQRNPEWYIPTGFDPVLEVYELYDAVVGEVQRQFPKARLMLATGLHQDPEADTTFYWRLKDHRAFLEGIGVSPTRIQPLMSRDFALDFADADLAAAAALRLASVSSEGGIPLFEIDNRGSNLFVTLTWPNDISEDFLYSVGGQSRSGLREQVAFVAIKNGGHNGVGYLLDTGGRVDQVARIPLYQLPARIAGACGVSWPSLGQLALDPAA